jgi:hypothetical protein
MRLSPNRGMAVAGWGSLVIAWIVAVAADPTGKNRPSKLLRNKTMLP